MIKNLVPTLSRYMNEGDKPRGCSGNGKLNEILTLDAKTDWDESFRSDC